MVQRVIKAFQESISVKEKFARENAETIVEVSRLIANAFNEGKKLILFGNGGSAADASHIAAGFISRFKRDRPGLPAISLNTDTAVITALSSDYDFSEVFSRQLKAIGEEGDIVVAISTTAAHANIMKAVDVARKKKLKVVAFTCPKGDKLTQKSNYAFIVPSEKEQRVKETHVVLGHVICQTVEEILFDAPRKA